MANEEEVEIKDPQGLFKAHEKAKADLVALREELKTVRAELEAVNPEEITKWRTRAVSQAAKAALEKEGIKNPERILKYLNLDGVDFDDKDALTGLDDKLSTVKTDFPELFDTKRRAGRQSADIHANQSAEVAVDPMREQVKAALGR